MQVSSHKKKYIYFAFCIWLQIFDVRLIHLIHPIVIN